MSAQTHARLPIVTYLNLETDPPSLTATVCSNCEARYLGARIACARCGGRQFIAEQTSGTGEIASFTTIHRAPPGTDVPYTSVIVRLDDGTYVKSNLQGPQPSSDDLRAGQRVQLRTYVCGTDVNGVEAIAFGFKSIEETH